MATLQQQFPNPGVYILENDTSIFSRTSYSGVIYLVVGSSIQGPHNAPVLVENVNQFRNTFGEIDYKLERKSSYFHRTAEKLLQTGPVYCLSLLPTDSEIDRLSWKSYSCATHLFNANIATTAYQDLFDRTGFWRRTTDQVSFIAQQQESFEDRLLHIVNYGSSNLTIFIIKSEIGGLDVAFEDWYGSTELVPSYLSAKDWPNDYIVRFIAVGGDFTNYSQLALSNQWSQYFNTDGLIKDAVSSFVRASNINLIADYNVSLIPYFKDKNGRDLFIESIINRFTATTGIFCSFDSDRFETDYRNGLVDLIGQNLIQETSFVLDYLSYQEVVADTIVISESKLDVDNNSWGDPNWYIGRTNLLTEGFVYNTFMKPLILSLNSSYLVQPLNVASDSYAILGGKQIDLSQSIDYYLDLDELSLPESHFAFVVVLTMTGIDFRVGIVSPNTSQLSLPLIDVLNEIVLGYYRINTTASGLIETTLVPITITEEHLTPSNSFIPGWIPAFKLNAIDTSEPSRISFKTYPTQPSYQLIMKFENAAINSNDYHDNRVKYLFNSLITRITENKTIILDLLSVVSPTGGAKQVINYVQIQKDGQHQTILIEVENHDANIKDIGVPDPITKNYNIGYVSIYFSDFELILQEEKFATSTNQPYQFGQGGVLGHDSELYQQYYDGTVNTGDRVFKEIATEFNVKFRVRDGRNELAFEGVPAEIYIGKLFISGTQRNDGIYIVVSNYIIDNRMTLILFETVAEEFLEELTIYDANREFYLEFSFQGDELAVQYTEQHLGKDPLYKKSSTTTSESYRQTLEIEKIIDNYTILVDFERYSNDVFEGQFIRIETSPATQQFEIERGLGRVIEAFQYDLDARYLYIKADSPIWFKVLNFAIPSDGVIVKFEEIISELYLGIDNWALTYKGAYFKGFNIRQQSLPDGTDARLNEILALTVKGTGIFNALSNLDNITWRYLVDSYGIGFDQTVKRPLAQLCETHNSFGFINMPSVKQFITNDFVVFNNDGTFDVDILVKGGIRKTIQAPRFNLIDGDESTYIAYYFPNLIVQDIDSRRPISVPPSAWAASTFVENKWQTNLSNQYPWSAVAGLQFSEFTDISNLEFSFPDQDLGKLHQFNINPFTKNSLGQFWIYSNNTAYIVTSSLGFINVREALIELETALRQMLLNFQWQFNTREVRRTIQTNANIICENFKSKSAINDYTNIMDETNNTPEIIDANIGVLDTYVEPIQSMGTIVLRVQILKTGQLQSSQFLR